MRRSSSSAASSSEPSHTPFDAFERGERGFDCRPLAIGAKVRPQPRVEVARAPDVEHLVVLVAEEVDAGPLRRPEGEAALALHPPRLRGCQLDEVADGACAALLRHADQAQEDLGRRLGVGQRAMAGPRRRSRSGTRARRDSPAGVRAAGARARPCRRPSHRLASRSAASSRDRGTPCRSARCARRARVTGEGEEAPDDRGDRRSAPQLFVAEPGQRGDRRLEPLRPGSRAVSKRSVSSRRSTRTAPNSHGRADPGRRPVVSRSKTTKVASSRSSSSARRAGQSDQVARPAQPRVGPTPRRRAATARARRGPRSRASGRPARPRRRQPGPDAPRRARRAGRRHRGAAARRDASTNVCSCPSPAAARDR